MIKAAAIALGLAILTVAMVLGRLPLDRPLAVDGLMQPGELAVLVAGVAARGVLGQCEAVLSGYLGDAGIGEAVLHAVAVARSANPAALYCCDPVIGDAEPGVYVRAGIPDFLRTHCLPQADILTPNQFELELLAPGYRSGAVATLAEVALAAQALRQRMRAGGEGLVLVTSVEVRS